MALSNNHIIDTHVKMQETRKAKEVCEGRRINRNKEIKELQLTDLVN